MVWIFRVSFPSLSSAKVSMESRISCMFVCNWPGLNPPPLHQAIRVSRRGDGHIKATKRLASSAAWRLPPFTSLLFLYLFVLFFSSFLPPLSQWRLSIACCCVSSVCAFSVLSMPAHSLVSQKGFFFLNHFLFLCGLCRPLLAISVHFLKHFRWPGLLFLIWTKTATVKTLLNQYYLSVFEVRGSGFPLLCACCYGWSGFLVQKPMQDLCKVIVFSIWEVWVSGQMKWLWY